MRKYKNNIEVIKKDDNGNIVETYKSIMDAERLNGYGKYTLRKHHLAGKNEVVKDGYKYVFMSK